MTSRLSVIFALATMITLLPATDALSQATYTLTRARTDGQPIAADPPCDPNNTLEQCFEDRKSTSSSSSIQGSTHAAAHASIAQGIVQGEAYAQPLGQDVAIARFQDVVRFSGPDADVELTLDVDGFLRGPPVQFDGNGGRIQVVLCTGNTPPNQIPSCGGGADATFSMFYDPATGTQQSDVRILDLTDQIVVSGNAISLTQGHLSLAFNTANLSSFSFVVAMIASASRSTPGESAADAFNTAQLGIVVPPGVSYTSDSGVLLTTAVPEPRTWIFALAGLILLGAPKVTRWVRRPA